MSIGNEIEKWKETLEKIQDEILSSDGPSDGSRVHPFTNCNINQVHTNLKDSIGNVKQQLEKILRMENIARVLIACQDIFQQQEKCKHITTYLQKVVETVAKYSADHDTDYLLYLEIIAKSTNLKFVHHGDNCFISSDMFYVEVTLKNHQEVLEVKVVHGEDPKVTPVMTDLLRKRQFQEFRRHLLGLSNLYQLRGTINEKSLAFMALQAVETDLSTLAAYQNLSGQNDFTEIINKGYVGHVTDREGGLPMKLTFYVTPSDMFDTSLGKAIDPQDAIQASTSIGCSASVLIEQGKTCLLPKLPIVVMPIQITDIPSYKKLSGDNSAKLPASFVLLLDNYVPVDATIMAKIYRLINGQDKQYTNSASVSVEDLLAANICKEKTKQDCQLKRNSFFTVALPDQKHKYIFCKSWDSSPLGSLLVKRIPFANPQQVPRIINLLRQQIVFNELIKSCMFSEPKATEDEEMDVTMFEVITCPPNLLSVTFRHPLSHYLMCVEISINEGGGVSGRVCICQGDASFCTDEWVTKILQACLNIPVTMRAVLRKSFNFTTEQQGDGHDIAIPSSNGSLDTDNQAVQFPNILSQTASLSVTLADAVEQNSLKRKRSNNEFESGGDAMHEADVRVVELDAELTVTASFGNDDSNNEIDSQPAKIFIEERDVETVISPVVGQVDYNANFNDNQQVDDVDKESEAVTADKVLGTEMEEPADPRVVSELEALVHNTVQDSPSTLTKDAVPYVQTIDIRSTTNTSIPKPITVESTEEIVHSPIEPAVNPTKVEGISCENSAILPPVDVVMTTAMSSVEDMIMKDSIPIVDNTIKTTRVPNVNLMVTTNVPDVADAVVTASVPTAEGAILANVPSSVGADILSGVPNLTGNTSVDAGKLEIPSNAPDLGTSDQPEFIPDVDGMLDLSRGDATDDFDQDVIASAREDILGLDGYEIAEGNETSADISVLEDFNPTEPTTNETEKISENPDSS